MYKQKLKVNLPSVEGLALALGISRNTIYDWESEHPEFSDIINVLRAKQAVKLLNSGLSGEYNPFIAKALLSKHGYSEKQEISHEIKSKQVFEIGGQRIEF
jgi:DNA-binding XRE family transcriptional regulator